MAAHFRGVLERDFTVFGRNCLKTLTLLAWKHETLLSSYDSVTKKMLPILHVKTNNNNCIAYNAQLLHI